MSIKEQYQQFQDYYEQYRDKVYSFIYYRCHSNKDLAEDITSDVFLKAYEKFEDYNEKYAFSTWIFTIARNKVIDYFRVNKETQDLEQGFELEDKKNTPEKMKKNIDVEMKTKELKVVMKELPEIQRECILMRYFGEMSNSEIAEALGRKETNVRQLLSRGLKKMKELSGEMFVSLLIMISLISI